jgi:hypothetical protein
MFFFGGFYLMKKKLNFQKKCYELCYAGNGNFAKVKNFGKVLITKHLHKNKSSNYNRLKYNQCSIYFFV